MPFDSSLTLPSSQEWPWELQNFELEDNSLLDLSKSAILPFQDTHFELKIPEEVFSTPSDFSSDSPSFCNPFFPQHRRLSNAWNPPIEKPPAVVHVCPVCQCDVQSSTTKISEHVPACFLKQSGAGRSSDEESIYTSQSLVSQLRKMIVEMDVIQRINLSESLNRLARGIEKADDINALSLLFGKPATRQEPASMPDTVPSAVLPIAIPAIDLHLHYGDTENLRVDLNVVPDDILKGEKYSEYQKKGYKESFANCTTPITFSKTGDFDDGMFALPQPIRNLKRGRDEINPIVQAIPFSPRSKMLCV